MKGTIICFVGKLMKISGQNDMLIDKIAQILLREYKASIYEPSDYGRSYKKLNQKLLNSINKYQFN